MLNKKVLTAIAGVTLLLAGCSKKNDEKVMVPAESPRSVVEQDVVIKAIGMGVIQEGVMPAPQALAMGKRAAITDAYRQLGEKIYGIRVNATDTVKDMIAKNSTVKTEVSALVKNANIEETVCQDGLCQVAMEVRIDASSWRAISGY
jgi:hypothetical protein